ncbi:uncharacterized protein LOC125504267 isoform X2 [Dendroctonus ponderosae]|nr:uncharacterized protein LOC125504053 isoform X2 [Dendroctonus ponderosae]XP_048521351.1 uncharacterized protein LOC125504056 isoform X2 [Dendroctonus ponderosae]XP_048521836.1 uncharacterized protein LOC125504209 isoform X2 [Dendroctonus ponderosae]XP_048521970.1 uncharacterized protein LOC125504267 isoform X2 [Dendroctonus ponderosae]
MNYSNKEKRDMIETYIRSDKNARRVSDYYFERHFDRRQRSLKTLKRLYENLGTYGSFTQPRNEDKAINEAVEVNVLAIVRQNPQISARDIAAESGTFQSTVMRGMRSCMCSFVHGSETIANKTFNSLIKYCGPTKLDLQIVVCLIVTMTIFGIKQITTTLSKEDHKLNLGSTIGAE